MQSILALSLFLASVAMAETRSTPREIAMDYSLACEISKMVAPLTTRQAFKDDKPELAKRIGSLLLAGLKTPEARKTFTASLAASPSNRRNLWEQSAKESGLKGWTCATIDQF